jgi:hypothetical protein
MMRGLTPVAANFNSNWYGKKKQISGYITQHHQAIMYALIFLFNIRIRVKNSSDNIVADSGLLACSQRSARLDKIAAGGGYRIEVEGLINDQVAWYGDRSHITVIANQSTDPIMIAMSYTGDVLPNPATTISPAASATNVPTDSAILIRFDHGVVPATISTNSIRVTDGLIPVHLKCDVRHIIKFIFMRWL